MDYGGRYYSARDVRFINSVNAELLRNIIQTLVTCFKIAADFTPVNIYGESNQKQGKSYYEGVELSCLIDRGDITSKDEGFGSDRDQSVVFKFRTDSCKDANYYPQVGDILLFNDRYHEIDNVVEEQLLGGQSSKSYSIICNTHYSRLSKFNIINRT